ncbi:MAG: SMR family transporter [Verrucomicrobiota bacterium]|jgi:small multidrug resistance pump
MNWLYLAVAIVSEVISTSVLKSSSGFTKLWPSAIVVAGYTSAFYFLSLTLRTIPVGVAYAIWSGVGIVLIAIVGWIVYGQKLDLAAILGMVLIVVGIVIINCLSHSVPH